MTTRVTHPARIAIAHEWLGPFGGSESMFAQMAKAIPEADLYALWGSGPPELTERPTLSWLSRTPAPRHKLLALPLMPLAWRTLTREPYDIVVSSSHALAHTVRLRQPGTTYLSYVYAPMRYLWTPDLDERGRGLPQALARRPLQWADRRLGAHVNSIATISEEIRTRINDCWGRDSTVLYPSFDEKFFVPTAPASSLPFPRFLLHVGRFIHYKNADVSMEVAAAAGLPLVIAGWGPDEGRLRARAAHSLAKVQFVVSPTRERLRELFTAADALLFPAHEDFGLVPLEAMACGTPVVAWNRGGALETVRPGESGVLVDTLDPQDWCAALDATRGLDPVKIQHAATEFGNARFRSEFRDWVLAHV